MAEVDAASAIGGGWRGPVGRSLVWLADDPLMEDADACQHQQPQVADDVRGEVLVTDVSAVDVQPEALALDAAAV